MTLMRAVSVRELLMKAGFTAHAGSGAHAPPLGGGGGGLAARGGAGGSGGDGEGGGGNDRIGSHAAARFGLPSRGSMVMRSR